MPTKSDNGGHGWHTNFEFIAVWQAIIKIIQQMC